MDLPTFMLHWSIACSALVSLASGLRIAADHRTGVAGELLRALEPVILDGSVFVVHLVSAAVLLTSVTAYLAFVVRAKQQGRFRVSGLRDARLRTNRLLHWFGLLLLTGLGLSGWANLTEMQDLAGESIRSLHFWLAMSLLGYAIVHPLAHVAHGGWFGLSSALGFRLKRWRALPLAMVTGVAATAVFGAFELSRTPHLEAMHVTSTPVVDGIVDDPAWQIATTVVAYAKLGNPGQPGGTPIAVQAVHDSQRLYLHLSWPDDQDSQQHLPLVKRSDGWHVMHAGFEQDDEREFYEDKLAVMLSKDGLLSAASSIHLGPRPLPDAPAPRHRRGYHYTDDGTLLDVWHWKSARTNPLFQADDNHFRAPARVAGCEVRYKAGYYADPKLAGGIKENWLAFSQAGVTPKRLPRSSHFVSTDQGQPSTAPFAPNRMRWSDGFPYAADLDTLPPGSMLPSILSRDPYQGDRGQVGARGRWSDGHWHLELTRALDTGSAYDVPLTGETYLWFAPFDHAQTRHAYHLRPVRLTLGTPDDEG